MKPELRLSLTILCCALLSCLTGCGGMLTTTTGYESNLQLVHVDGETYLLDLGRSAVMYVMTEDQQGAMDWAPVGSLPIIPGLQASVIGNDLYLYSADRRSLWVMDMTTAGCNWTIVGSLPR